MYFSDDVFYDDDADDGEEEDNYLLTYLLAYLRPSTATSV